MIPTIYAEDACGTVGSAFTSLTFSFAPGELSTGGFRGPTTAPFNFADFPCPPLTELPNPYIYHGNPYKPQIVPPSQLYDLNPAFKTCFLYPGTCYDPPYAITPTSSLSPLTTPSVKIGSPAPTPTPGPKPKSVNPTQTSTLVAASPETTKQLTAPVAPTIASYAGTSPVIASGLGTVNPEDTMQSVSQAASATAFDFASSAAPPDSADSTFGGKTGELDPSASLGGLQDISQTIPITTESNAAAPLVLASGAELIIGDATFLPNPTMFPVGSQVVSQGGPAVTIFNTPLSLGSLGLLIGTTKTVLFDPALEFTIDGQAFTAAPSGFEADGKTLLPSRPGLTLDGGKIVASLSPDDGDIVLVENGRTTTIVLTQTTSIGLGGVIMSGFALIDPPQITPSGLSSSRMANGSEVYFTGRGSKILAIPSLRWCLPLFVFAGIVTVSLYP